MLDCAASPPVLATPAPVGGYGPAWTPVSVPVRCAQPMGAGLAVVQDVPVTVITAEEMSRHPEPRVPIPKVSGQAE